MKYPSLSCIPVLTAYTKHFNREIALCERWSFSRGSWCSQKVSEKVWSSHYYTHFMIVQAKFIWWQGQFCLAKKYLWLVGCPYCRSLTVGFLEESTTLFSWKTEAMIHYQGGKNVICTKQWGCRFVPVSELIAILIYLTIRAVHQKYVSMVHQSRFSCWNWVLHVCVCCVQLMDEQVQW